MSKRAMKIKPICEIDELRTAHDVRRIRPCTHCKGIGFHESMVRAGGSFYHPQCYLAAEGFRSVTKLPLSERDKYRLCDVNVRQMRRLLELR